MPQRSPTPNQLFALALSCAVVILLLVFPHRASAKSDADCLNSCIMRGERQDHCLQSCNVIMLDHRCLSICTAQGALGTNRCRASCSYIKPEALLPQQLPRSDAHSQFTEIHPADPTIIIVPTPEGAPNPPSPTLQAPPQWQPTVQPLSPSTNQKCVALCVNQGMTSAYCKQTCSY